MSRIPSSFVASPIHDSPTASPIRCSRGGSQPNCPPNPIGGNGQQYISTSTAHAICQLNTVMGISFGEWNELFYPGADYSFPARYNGSIINCLPGSDPNNVLWQVGDAIILTPTSPDPGSPPPQEFYFPRGIYFAKLIFTFNLPITNAGGTDHFQFDISICDPTVSTASYVTQSVIVPFSSIPGTITFGPLALDMTRQCYNMPIITDFTNPLLYMRDSFGNAPLPPQVACTWEVIITPN